MAFEKLNVFLKRRKLLRQSVFWGILLPQIGFEHQRVALWWVSGNRCRAGWQRELRADQRVPLPFCRGGGSAGFASLMTPVRYRFNVLRAARVGGSGGAFRALNRILDSCLLRWRTGFVLFMTPLHRDLCARASSCVISRVLPCWLVRS